jgi:hypothetical protein
VKQCRTTQLLEARFEKLAQFVVQNAKQQFTNSAKLKNEEQMNLRSKCHRQVETDRFDLSVTLPSSEQSRRCARSNQIKQPLLPSCGLAAARARVPPGVPASPSPQATRPRHHHPHHPCTSARTHPSSPPASFCEAAAPAGVPSSSFSSGWHPSVKQQRWRPDSLPTTEAASRSDQISSRSCLI